MATLAKVPALYPLTLLRNYNLNPGDRLSGLSRHAGQPRTAEDSRPYPRLAKAPAPKARHVLARGDSPG